MSELPINPARARKGGRAATWLAGLLPLLLVAGSVYGYLAWWKPGADATAAKRAAADDPPEARAVRPGKDYYVFVRTLEAYPQPPGGGPWDRGPGEAPDLWYQLVWQGQTVFESDARADGLVALWDPISVDVREALLGSGKLELASTLNQGAVVNVAPGQTLEVVAWDQDALVADPVGSVTLRIDALLEGDNTFSFEPGPDNAVKRIVVAVTGTDQPVTHLFDALRAP